MILVGALVTNIGWAVFGLAAGGLYGLWAGRSVSARRLKSVGPLVAAGTSILLAWAEKPITEAGLDAFADPPGFAVFDGGSWSTMASSSWSAPGGNSSVSA